MSVKLRKTLLIRFLNNPWGKAFLLVPEGYAPRFDFPLSPASARLTHVDGPLWVQEVEFGAQEDTVSIPFTVSKKSEAGTARGM